MFVAFVPYRRSATTLIRPDSESVPRLIRATMASTAISESIYVPGSSNHVVLDPIPGPSPGLPQTSAAEIGQVLQAPSSTAAPSDHARFFTSDKQTQKLRAGLHLFAIYLSMFLAGWNDGSSGPLIPRMQRVYSVGFMLVSLTFVVSCIGFISGALLNSTSTVVSDSRLSYYLAFPCPPGAVCQALAFTTQAPAPPFPLFVIWFGINGLGYAIQNAQTNTYVASLGKSSEVSERSARLMSSSYGAGALSSPLVATQFASMTHWSFHYLVSLGIALLNVTVLVLTFRFRSQEECLRLIGQEPSQETSTSERSNFGQIFSLRAVHLLASFSPVYVGVEVTIGGWITTYIIDIRGGGASSGYISSGFFGGLMISRLALLWLNKKMGEEYVLYLYAALVIALELIVWLVPSLIGGAVAVSLVGVFLGPIYPIIMNRTGRVVPRWLLSGSIGWIACFGQAGSALIPFLTGAIASKAGRDQSASTFCASLSPSLPLLTRHRLISMMACFPILWALVPRTARRID
ncbi:MFS domain-containing protein [Mycena kentingensis (nom. inval.)]|nr:MFS domain-containing protein [Mycena kentingensis (nom. inval.)]